MDVSLANTPYSIPCTKINFSTLKMQIENVYHKIFRYFENEVKLYILSLAIWWALQPIHLQPIFQDIC